MPTKQMLQAQLDAAYDTNKRLNRRCQKLESELETVHRRLEGSINQVAFLMTAARDHLERAGTAANNLEQLEYTLACDLSRLPARLDRAESSLNWLVRAWCWLKGLT